MSSKVIIAAVAGVVVIGSAVAGVFLLGNNNESNSNNQQSTQSQQGQPSGQPNTELANIDTLLARGKNQKCTFTTTSENIKTDATIYFSNKRLNSEFTSVDGAKTTKGNMIISEDTQWFWDPADKKGVKFSLNQQSTQSQQGQPSGQGLDTKQNYEFTCEDWQVDEARFTPPTDVTFTDFSNIQSLQDIRVGQ